MNPLTKYIIVQKSGLETAILVHPSVSHNEAVNPEVLAANGGRLLSAGYYALVDGQVELSEMPSTTLNLAPRPQDAAIIDQTLALNHLAPREALSL